MMTVSHFFKRINVNSSKKLYSLTNSYSVFGPFTIRSIYNRAMRTFITNTTISSDVPLHLLQFKSVSTNAFTSRNIMFAFTEKGKADNRLKIMTKNHD